jgi:hypothetical protein
MKKNLSKIFAGKETPKEEAAERRAAKKMAPKAPKRMYEKLERKYEPGVHKDEKGYKAGGAIRMANGGLNPRMSRGFGPGIAAGMGRGSGSVPGAMMAKGGGVESKKNPPKMVKMAKGGGVESKGKTRGKFV